MGRACSSRAHHGYLAHATVWSQCRALYHNTLRKVLVISQRTLREERFCRTLVALKSNAAMRLCFVLLQLLLGDKAKVTLRTLVFLASGTVRVELHD